MKKAVFFVAIIVGLSSFMSNDIECYDPGFPICGPNATRVIFECNQACVWKYDAFGNRRALNGINEYLNAVEELNKKHCTVNLPESLDPPAGF